MNNDEWMRAMVLCKSDVARRLMMAVVALLHEETDPAARKKALAFALICSEKDLDVAMQELARVGLAEFKWLS